MSAPSRGKQETQDGLLGGGGPENFSEIQPLGCLPGEQDHSHLKTPLMPNAWAGAKQDLSCFFLASFRGHCICLSSPAFAVRGCSRSPEPEI